MQQLKDLIEQLGSDPYEILNTDPKSDITVLRKNYRILAIKYHPDKNDEESAKLMFLKVNQAYQYLEQQENRKIYQSYIKSIEQQRKRTEGLDQKRRKFAEDLKRRQEQHLKTQTEIEKQLKKRKQFFQKKMEEAEQRQSIKNEIMDSMGVQQYYVLISTFDINWGEGLSFTQKMLTACFQQYGKIDKIKIQPKRNKASITLNSIQDCTKAVSEFRHPLITIKYHLEASKREHLLKALNKQKVEKLDLSLSSQNIERFKQIVNRGSGIYRPNYRTDF